MRGIRLLSRPNQLYLSSLRQQSSGNVAAEVEAARPWEDIPSPPWVPIVGNLALAFKKPKDKESGFSLNVKHLFERYDPDGVGMLRIHSLPFNPGKGGGRIILMVDPECIEVSLRQQLLSDITDNTWKSTLRKNCPPFSTI